LNAGHIVNEKKECFKIRIVFFRVDSNSEIMAIFKEILMDAGLKESVNSG